MNELAGDFRLSSGRHWERQNNFAFCYTLPLVLVQEGRSHMSEHDVPRTRRACAILMALKPNYIVRLVDYGNGELSAPAGRRLVFLNHFNVDCA